MDNNSLSHTTWNCKYHIVFAPKYRRKIIYSELKQDIANILSMLCKRKEVNIVEAEICPDHVHMLVEIPPKMSVSDFVGYLKGKSTLMIFERHANLKYKYGCQRQLEIVRNRRPNYVGFRRSHVTFSSVSLFK